jgi:hypothetical protein
VLLIDVADSGDLHAWIAHEDFHGGKALPAGADDAQVYAFGGKHIGTHQG